MNLSYTAKYAASDLWHTSNRPFSVLNIVAIAISMAALVSLIGSGLALRDNKEKMMDRLGLRIEISHKKKEPISTPIIEDIKKIQGVHSLHRWTATLFLFYNKEGILQDGIGGQTIELNDLQLDSLRDMRTNESIKFLAKEKTKQVHDEIGIIIPFVMLKQLGYVSSKADENKPETWENISFPEHMKIRVKSITSGLAKDINLPIVGVVPELEGGRFLVTKDCNQILANWQEDLEAVIANREGYSIFTGEKVKYENHVSEVKIIHSKLNSQTEEELATVYVNSRDVLLNVIQEIREKDLLADCALEFFLRDYKQQESFFVIAAGGICLTLLIFSGVILFSTFYSLVLRKRQEVGILKAYGGSATLIHHLLTLEAIILGAIAIGLGTIMGIFLGEEMAVYAQKALELEKIDWFIFPLSYAGITFVFGIIFCILVTFIPVRMAVNLEPDQAIRT